MYRDVRENTLFIRVNIKVKENKSKKMKNKILGCHELHNTTGGSVALFIACLEQNWLLKHCTRVFFFKQLNREKKRENRKE